MNKNPQEVSTSIYSRLLAGESIEDIAEEFADELNAAQERYEEEMARRAEEEERKRLEEEAAAKAREAEVAAQDAKVADLIHLLLEAMKFCRAHYPELVNDEIEEDDDMETLARFLIALLDSSSTKVDWGFAAYPALKWLLN